MERSLFDPGENCWKVRRANRGDFLIDGEEYFRSVYRAFIEAQNTIYITGWEINSQVKLVPERYQFRHYPTKLSKLLDQLARERPHLSVYILIWNYASFYAIERELFPAVALDWRTHKNVHFHRDDEHPIGASQHQKFVVVDDQMAFCGGLDLTHRRWDTKEHLARNPVRVDHRERHYPPFHDVQMAVTGPAALALGNLFRERWKHATGTKLPHAHADLPENRFPLRSDFKNARIAIARTLSPYKGKPLVREVEHLYLDMIRAAERYLYIETQYFTAEPILEALCESLQAPQGPEVVIVLPQKAGGWLEENVMGVKQAECLARLWKADRHNRLGVYYPYIPNLRQHEYLIVHSKVMIADDKLVRVGSANLTNRSMGLDSECDLVLEADEKTSESVRTFRDRLIGEHLDCEPNEIAAAFESPHGLRGLIQEHRGRREHRHLIPMNGNGAVVPLSKTMIRFGDRKTPTALDLTLDRHFFKRFRSRHHLIRTTITISLVIAFMLAAVVAIWHYTPVHELVNQAKIRAVLLEAKESGIGIGSAVVIFFLLTLLFVPLNALTLTAATVFDSPTAIACVMVGIALSSSCAYLMGKWLGKTMLKKYFPEMLEEVARHAKNRGFTPILVIRLLPIAPFTAVNLVSGAAQYHFGYYFFGTLIAALPGTLCLILFQKSLISAILNPNLLNASLFILFLVVLTFGIHYLKKRISL